MLRKTLSLPFRSNKPKSQRPTSTRRRTRALLLEGLELRNLMAGDVAGSIYDDVNRNSALDAGENGIQGWTVFLDLNRDGVQSTGEPNTKTNKDGDYLIKNVAAGNYRVTEVVPDKWLPTSPMSQDIVVVNGKETKATFFDFGGGSISGVAWSDQNNDGNRDVDPSTGLFIDPALIGWTLFLDLDSSTTLDAGEPTSITDAEGRYQFNELPAGDYDVTEVLPSGWEATKGQDWKQTVTVDPVTDTVQDFGNFSSTNGSIVGIVFNDFNGNAARDVDAVTGAYLEPGLKDWVVFIDTNNNRSLDSGELSAITDADGRYTFLSLTPGDYEVTEVLQNRWDVSTLDIRQTVHVASGEITNAFDFGNFTVLDGQVAGVVWNDINQNGVRDSDPFSGVYLDPPLTGWQVFLDLNRNGVEDLGEPASATDIGGNYFFPNLQVGDYDVIEVLPTGWETSIGYNSHNTVTVFSGSTTNAPDFANFETAHVTPGAVHGTVWDDVNGDSIRQATDPGLLNWSLFIDINNDGVFTTGEPQTTTNAAGAYTFTGITPGTVTIRVVALSGWRGTAPISNSATLTLRGGQDISGIDFGQYAMKESFISGSVFSDANLNGTRDLQEKGLAGITVYLDLNNDGTLQTTEPSIQTSIDQFYTPGIDESGIYEFTHLAAGTYVVRSILPATLSATPASELVHSIALGVGQHQTGVNTAGVYRKSEIHGVKFEDKDGDSVRDPDEGPMAGAKVFIDSDRDGILDPTEPWTTTATDGSYVFTELAAGTYVVREEYQVGYSQTSPTTKGGILWPAGVSNPAVGDVTPTSITTSLDLNQHYSQTVSITLPGTGGLTNLVDVFLLFDDTGSFVNNSPIVRAAFPDIISRLQTSLPSLDLGFGVGRMEEYGNFAYEYATGRPFTLNQPIVAASTSGYMTSIQAGLNRTTPGYGGDTPETDIEALFQVVTGKGFDGNDNGTVLDSGNAGLASTQLSPGNSGDVPSFASFTPDPANNVMPAAGNVGGAGFRSGALPIILLATDTGFAYQPKGETAITGSGGLTVPLSSLTQTSRPTTPFNRGAGIQETITALNSLGALVIGLGTNPQANIDPRQQLESISKLTGAINRSTTTIANGTTDQIAPGDPLYFQIASGFSTSVANGVVNAIENAVTNVAVDVDVIASDPKVHIINHTGVLHGIGKGMSASFDIEFVGDGAPRRFDLQFVRAGTNVVLGSIPVVLGTPIPTDGYHFDELEDGEIELDDHFSDILATGVPSNQVPSFTAGGNVSVQEDQTGTTYVGWATNISAGTGETSQQVDFIVSNDNATLFATAPSISAGGDLQFSLAADSFGSAVVVVKIHDNGGTANGGIDTSAPQTFTITVAPVNDAPKLEHAIGNVQVDESSSDMTIDLTGVFSDVDDASLTLSTSSSNVGLVSSEILGNNLILHFAPQTNGTATIALVATDAAGLIATTILDVTVSNSLPSLTVTSQDGFEGVTGQLRVLQFTASDNTDNGTRNFNFEVDWGDGSALETIAGSASSVAGHTYVLPKVQPIKVRAIDPDGGSSPWVTKSLNVQRVELQGTELAIGGTDGNDTLTWTPSVLANTGIARLNGIIIANQSLPANGVRFFGGIGRDGMTIQGLATDDNYTFDGSNVQWTGVAPWTTSIRFATDNVEVTRIVSLGGNDQLGISSGSVEFDGGVGTDRLVAADTDNAWRITGTGVGTLNGQLMAGVETLIGGAANDIFAFENGGRIVGALQGGLGSNQIDYHASSTAVAVNLATNAATRTLNATGIQTWIGSSFADTFTGDNQVNGWFVGVDGLVSLNTTTSIRGFETLGGGTLSDTFSIEEGTLPTPTLSGNGGLDTLSYSSWTTPIAVNRALSSGTRVPLFRTIENFVGGSQVDTLTGLNAAAIWSITGPNAGTASAASFASFESLVGGSLNDTFKFIGGSVASIQGAAGIDTVQGGNQENSWSISGANSGTLNGANQYSDIENLTGGSLVDNFEIAETGSVSGTVNGGLGTNGLSYSTWTNGVIINDVQGVSSGIGKLSANFQLLIGGHGHDRIHAFSAVPSVILGNQGNDSLFGSLTGRDLLFGGQGIDELHGAGGDDILFGGETLLDNDRVALAKIHAEWKSTRTYQQRVENIQGTAVNGIPLNESYYLSDTPVDSLIDDHEVDTLFGEAGTDWFIASALDDLRDKIATERVLNSN